jgi:hypothetical protein
MIEISSGAPRGTSRTWPRTVLAYVLTLIGLTAVVTIAGAGGSLLPGSLYVGVLLGITLLPAAALALNLVGRDSRRSPIRRALLGAVSWFAWYLVLGVAVFVARTIGLWPEGFVALLGLVAIAGAVFAVLAPADRPPARVTSVAALLVAAGLITGCFITAGWWGGPT